MKQEHRYLYIRAWGKKLGLDKAYTERIVRKAIDENAPDDVVCQTTDGWATVSSITNLDFRSRLERAVEKMKAEIKEVEDVQEQSACEKSEVSGEAAPSLHDDSGTEA